MYNVDFPFQVFFKDMFFVEKSGFLLLLFNFALIFIFVLKMKIYPPSAVLEFKILDGVSSCHARRGKGWVLNFFIE